MTKDTRRAVVTGATRGIGLAAALALADAGWDVAVTGRTRHAGEGRDDSEVGAGRPIPGSLDETVAEIERRGRAALGLVADLHDYGAAERAFAQVLDEWGGVDLLVNNAVDGSAGGMAPLLELTPELLARKLTANAAGQFVGIRAVLPGMLERGGGTIIDVTSGVALHDPPGPVGEGGWGLAYAASKAAFHRFAPAVAVELGGRGIRAFNLDPGFVETERQKANAAELGRARQYVGAPPSVPAAVITWLADHPGELDNGSTVAAMSFARTHGLHPEWRPEPS